MLKLGMVLLGTAMLFHGRGKPEKKKEEEEESDTPFGTPGTKYNYEPTLDPAVQAVPASAGYPNPFNWSQEIDPAALDRLTSLGGFGTRVDAGVDLQGAAITRQQLSSANHMYNALIQSIPNAVRQKVSNIQRLANFHRRLARRVFG